jgi:hypothetical protein
MERSDGKALRKMRQESGNRSDRNKPRRPIKRICTPCHTGRLLGDLRRILGTAPGVEIVNAGTPETGTTLLEKR